MTPLKLVEKMIALEEEKLEFLQIQFSPQK
jgi:hypothetical protein